MGQPDDSDEALMARYTDGDAQAFGILFRRHELRLWRYLERNVGDRASAEELMQEVWFAVARDAVRFRAGSSFGAWLFTIARNRVVDLVRSRRGQVSLDSVGYESDALAGQLTTEPAAGPLAAVVLQDQAQALRQALAQLPYEQRDAFLLHIEGELSVEQVASITRSSFETTKSRLRYARLKLRQLLREYA